MKKIDNINKITIIVFLICININFMFSFKQYQSILLFSSMLFFFINKYVCAGFLCLWFMSIFIKKKKEKFTSSPSITTNESLIKDFVNNNKENQEEEVNQEEEENIKKNNNQQNKENIENQTEENPFKLNDRIDNRIDNNIKETIINNLPDDILNIQELDKIGKDFSKVLSEVIDEILINLKNEKNNSNESSTQIKDKWELISYILNFIKKIFLILTKKGRMFHVGILMFSISIVLFFI